MKISGNVNNAFAPIIQFKIGRDEGSLSNTSFLLDTGFNGEVAISDSTFNWVQPRLGPVVSIKTAAGDVDFQTCRLWVQFGDRSPRDTEAIIFNMDALGMELLENCTLVMDIQRGNSFAVYV